MEPIDNIILSHGIKGPRPLRMTSKQYLNDVIQSNMISSLDLVANLIRSNKISDLIDYLDKKNKYELFFLIGADNLIEFHKWYKFKNILRTKLGIFKIKII